MKDDLFNFDESPAGGFDTSTNDYEAQLKKARILCIRGRFNQALAICESILDEDMENMGAYIEILRAHSEDFTVFEGADIEKDIHAIERLFPDIDDEEYIDFLQKRRKFLKEKENTVNNTKKNVVNSQKLSTSLQNKISSSENNNINSVEDLNQDSKNTSKKNTRKKSNVIISETRKNDDSPLTPYSAREIIENQMNYHISKVAEARITLEKHANNGDTNALYWLAGYYDTGKCGYPKDQEKALNFYQKAADSNNMFALYDLGVHFQSGNFVKKNLKKAFEYFKSSSDLGYSPAMYKVGCCYRDGKGVKKDLISAKKYFKMAADEGEDNAEESLKMLENIPSMSIDEAANILLYSNSEDSSNKVLEAKKAIEKHAENEDTFALYCLAVYHKYGSHQYPKNKEKAYAYLKRGADLNSSECLYSMANWYEKGEIVEKNLSKAFECYKKAADIDDATNSSILANRRVAECYRDGAGVKKDINKAVEYLRKYAKKGNSSEKDFAERELKKLGYKL